MTNKISTPFESRIAQKRLAPYVHALTALAELAYRQASVRSAPAAFRLASFAFDAGQYTDDGKPFLRLIATDERQQNIPGQESVWRPGLFTDVHIIGRAAMCMDERTLEALRDLAAQEWAHQHTLDLRLLDIVISAPNEYASPVSVRNTA